LGTIKHYNSQNVDTDYVDTPEFQHYASQPKNSTATRKRTGYRAMYKTDTHSDIIFWYLG